MIEVDGGQYAYAVAQWDDENEKWSRLALLQLDEDADALLVYLETEYPSTKFELTEV